MDEHDDSVDDLVLDPHVLVGVWANATRVHRGRDELTVDFVRRLPDRSRPVLVARAPVSHVVAVELRDQLGTMSGRCRRGRAMDEVPLPRSGVLRKGVLYRVPGPPRSPKRELAPEVLAVLERGRRKRIREYLESKRRGPTHL